MFSVCIPVFNEEENVERIIRNIQENRLWKSSRNKEILVCVNGSTDKSEAIIRTIAKKDKNLQVMVEKNKSKNAAWERLRDTANPKSEILFFVDADVVIDTDLFSNLYEYLQKNRFLAIAGAETVPVSEKDFFKMTQRSYYTRRNKTKHNSLSGRCYAIRRIDAKSVKMPTDPRIHEDRYLSLVFKGRYEIVPSALTYFKSANFFDRLHQLTRKRVSTMLLEKEYPEFFFVKENGQFTQKRLPRTKENWFSFEDPVGSIVNFLVWNLAGVNAHLALRSGIDTWVKTPSTKSLIP